MRLRIIEMLDKYNATHGVKLTMRELALMVWRDPDRDDQTKINRISALNTGKATANIRDIVDIGDALECGCDELISNYE